MLLKRTSILYFCTPLNEWPSGCTSLKPISSPPQGRIRNCDLCHQSLKFAVGVSDSCVRAVGCSQDLSISLSLHEFMPADRGNEAVLRSFFCTITMYHVMQCIFYSYSIRPHFLDLSSWSSSLHTSSCLLVAAISPAWAILYVIFKFLFLCRHRLLRDDCCRFSAPIKQVQSLQRSLQH